MGSFSPKACHPRPLQVRRPARAGLALGLVWAANGLVACGSGRTDAKAVAQAEPAEVEADPQPSTVAPASPSTPGVAKSGEVVPAVRWFEGDLDGALSEAKKSGRLVFVEVGAYWCPPCHELEEKTFTDVAFAEGLERLAVAVHVDAEKGAGPELVERYDVRAYPTMLLLEPTGVEKGRVVDFMPPAPLLASLREIADGGNVLATLEAKAKADPEGLEAAYDLAHAYALAANEAAAEPLLEAVIAGDADNAKGLASKALYDRALFVIYKGRGDETGAIEAYRALQSRFPDSPEALRAYRKIGRALNDLGKPDEAIASLDAMLEADPSSVASYGWFCFREKCHPEKGLAAVREAIDAGEASGSALAELHYLAGELAHATGDDASALASMKAAARHEPKSAFYKRMVRRFDGAGETDAP